MNRQQYVERFPYHALIKVLKQVDLINIDAHMCDKATLAVESLRDVAVEGRWSQHVFGNAVTFAVISDHPFSSNELVPQLIECNFERIIMVINSLEWQSVLRIEGAESYV